MIELTDYDLAILRLALRDYQCRDGLKQWQDIDQLYEKIRDECARREEGKT